MLAHGLRPNLQATHCAEAPAWTGRWRSPRGDRWWVVWACRDHPEGLTGRTGSGDGATTAAGFAEWRSGFAPSPPARKTLGVLALCGAVLVPMELLGTVTAGAAGPSTTVVIPRTDRPFQVTPGLKTRTRVPRRRLGPLRGQRRLDLRQDRRLDIPDHLRQARGWDTTDVPNGTYTLHSVVTDDSGQLGDQPGCERDRRQPAAAQPGARTLRRGHGGRQHRPDASAP